MQVVDVKEGTPAWWRWRGGGIGGADAAAVVGMSRYRTARRLWELKCAPPEGSPDEPDLGSARGRVLEVEARERYRALLGADVVPLCCAHAEREFLRASLDGWCEALQLPVEIKALRRADHKEALRGRVPRRAVPQCLHILLVTGAEEMHYVSYHPDGFPPREQLAVVAVRADATLLGELLLAERSFWDAVLAREPPPRPPWLSLSRMTTSRWRPPPST
jgi:putative phage-type endonuclease